MLGEMNHIKDAMIKLSLNGEKVNSPKKSKKSQVFRKIPSDDLVLRVVRSFGLKDLNDKTQFSRRDISIHNTINKVQALLPELEDIYLPCKSRSYLHGINEKNVTTILRQLLKTKKYTIHSQEKYIKGSKFILYQIVPYTEDSEDEDESRDDKSTGNNSDSTLHIIKQPVTVTF